MPTETICYQSSCSTVRETALPTAFLCSPSWEILTWPHPHGFPCYCRSACCTCRCSVHVESVSKWESTLRHCFRQKIFCWRWVKEKEGRNHSCLRLCNYLGSFQKKPQLFQIQRPSMGKLEPSSSYPSAKHFKQIIKQEFFTSPFPALVSRKSFHCRLWTLLCLAQGLLLWFHFSIGCGNWDSKHLQNPLKGNSPQWLEI